MADEAMSTFTNKIIKIGEREAIIFGALITDRVNNAATLKAGHLVTETGETYPDVVQTADGEASLGIVLEDQAGQYADDIDSVFADGDPVTILRVNFPAVVFCYMDQAVGAALVAGDIATVAGGTDGTVTNVDADYEIGYIGRFQTRDAAGSTDLRIEEVALG